MELDNSLSINSQDLKEIEEAGLDEASDRSLAIEISKIGGHPHKRQKVFTSLTA